MRGIKVTAEQLTVPQATRQARRHVDRIMPGVGATVESRLSHDLEADRSIVITTITFPESVGAANRRTLDTALYRLSGWWDSRVDATRITITRTR